MRPTLHISKLVSICDIYGYQAIKRLSGLEEFFQRKIRTNLRRLFQLPIYYLSPWLVTQMINHLEDLPFALRGKHFGTLRSFRFISDFVHIIIINCTIEVSSDARYIIQRCVFLNQETNFCPHFVS